MKRIYIAGPYSADSVMDVLHNIRLGIQTSYEVFAKGYAPFCPWLDFHYVLMDKDRKLNINDFYEYSLAWLKVSDAKSLIPVCISASFQFMSIIPAWSQLVNRYI